MQNKISYYQGTAAPKKYKVDKSDVAEPRFDTPFFNNYDLYDCDSGPGAGYHELTEYKSVSDFLKDRRKRSKFKIKSPNRKIAFRKILLKTAIDFATDDQIKSSPILSDDDSYSHSVYVGGMNDYVNPFYDFNDKSFEHLNFGRDYSDNGGQKLNDDSIKILLNLESEKPPYGLPDGLPDREDISDYGGVNPYFGTTDLGNTIFEGISF